MSFLNVMLPNFSNEYSKSYTGARPSQERVADTINLFRVSLDEIDRIFTLKVYPYPLYNV